MQGTFYPLLAFKNFSISVVLSKFITFVSVWFFFMCPLGFIALLRSVGLYFYQIWTFFNYFFKGFFFFCHPSPLLWDCNYKYLRPLDIAPQLCSFFCLYIFFSFILGSFHHYALSSLIISAVSNLLTPCNAVFQIRYCSFYL